MCGCVLLKKIVSAAIFFLQDGSLGFTTLASDFLWMVREEGREGAKETRGGKKGLRRKERKEEGKG